MVGSGAVSQGGDHAHQDSRQALPGEHRGGRRGAVPCRCGVGASRRVAPDGVAMGRPRIAGGVRAGPTGPAGDGRPGQTAALVPALPPAADGVAVRPLVSAAPLGHEAAPRRRLRPPVGFFLAEVCCGSLRPSTFARTSRPEALRCSHAGFVQSRTPCFQHGDGRSRRPSRSRLSVPSTGEPRHDRRGRPAEAPAGSDMVPGLRGRGCEGR